MSVFEDHTPKDFASLTEGSNALVWVRLQCDAVPDEKERAFRRQLCEAALELRWAEWEQTRLVFADWLSDRGGRLDLLEESAARADWRLVKLNTTPHMRGGVRVGSTPWFWSFVVKADNLDLRPAYSRHNTRWLLGFPPGSLVLVNRASDESFDCKKYPREKWPLKFTWVRRRDRRRVNGHENKGDVTASRPLGFLGVWEPRRVKKDEPSLFGEE